MHVFVYTYIVLLKLNKTQMKYIYTLVAGIMIIDFLSFIAWIVSNEIPQGQFYFGSLTANIIKLFI